MYYISVFACVRVRACACVCGGKVTICHRKGKVVTQDIYDFLAQLKKMPVKCTFSTLIKIYLNVLLKSLNHEKRMFVFAPVTSRHDIDSTFSMSLFSFKFRFKYRIWYEMQRWLHKCSSYFSTSRVHFQSIFEPEESQYIAVQYCTPHFCQNWIHKCHLNIPWGVFYESLLMTAQYRECNVL